LSISISNPLFAIILGLSVALAISYFYGHKKNLRLIERVSKCLEESLEPTDQEYTWLGGVLGFTGNFQVKGFDKVTASVFMLPRQSLLYFPFSYITTGCDRVEVMFYLKQKVTNEIHVIRKIMPSYRMPTIYEKESLHSENVQLHGKRFELMYRHRTGDVARFLAVAGRLEPQEFMHIALTPRKGIFYVRLKILPAEPEKISRAVADCLYFLKKWKPENYGAR